MNLPKQKSLNSITQMQLLLLAVNRDLPNRVRLSNKFGLEIKHFQAPQIVLNNGAMFLIVNFLLSNDSFFRVDARMEDVIPISEGLHTFVLDDKYEDLKLPLPC